MFSFFNKCWISAAYSHCIDLICVQLSGAAGALSLKGTPYWMAPEVKLSCLTHLFYHYNDQTIYVSACSLLSMTKN